MTVGECEIDSGVYRVCVVSCLTARVREGRKTSRFILQLGLYCDFIGC